jgi:hypothetical protein
MIITRHAAHPIDSTLLLCGRPIVRVHENLDRTEICDIGHQVNCPECRVTINYVRRCIAPSTYVCTRAA